MSGNIVAGDLPIDPDTHAFVYDLGAASPRIIDLGTLGGTWSSMKGVSGNIIVGGSDLHAGVHGFAYDLGAVAPKMRDLGTLGSTMYGGSSLAEAVSGNIVVGMSYTATYAQHAFAYDLAAASPKMRDLGTLGGGSSDAKAVSGDIVVGQSDGHAFAYDLGAAAPKMRDLGTLGGSWSSATGVSGNIVIGTSVPAGSSTQHAFVYDLGAPSPKMRDLGSLGGENCSRSGCVAATAAGVSGKIIVGSSYTADGTEQAFVYDLGAASPKMRSLNPPGGTSSATGVSGNIIVGTNGSGAFYYDLRAASPTMVSLGNLGGSPSVAVAVSGNIVAGDCQRPNMPGLSNDAVVWNLAVSATPPGAPTGLSVRTGPGSVTLSWSAPSDTGGRPITGYRVTPYVGSAARPTVTFNSTATTQSIDDLANGTAYTFTVAAINAAGVGRQSFPSPGITTTP